MSAELQQIQQFYKSFNIPLSTEWLESCIEWCKDGNLPPTYTIKDLQKMVYEQWLLLDLRDMEVPSLPRNLSHEKKYTLTGSYCLQMIQVVDISKPKFWQLQRIRGNVAKNTEAETDFGKRVLQLTCTDGVQEVEAMEFKPISCLNINLLPGTKIRITGPVTVRNGRLLVTEENVKCLGGSVDEIKVKYAAENVLARALRLEENPNPYPIDEKALEVTEANTTQNRTTNTENYNIPNQNRNQNQIFQAQTRNIVTTNSNTKQNVLRSRSAENTISNKWNANQDIPPEFQVDDELLRELEEDFEESSLRNLRMNTKISNTQKTNINVVRGKPNDIDRNRECNSPDLFDEMEADDELLNEHLDQIDVDHMASNVQNTVSSRNRNQDVMKKLENSGSSSKSIKNYKMFSDTGQNRVSKPLNKIQDFEISSSGNTDTKQFDEVITLDDSFDDIDIDLHLDNIDEEMANLPSSTQKRNDLKDRIKSPELKSRKVDLKNSKHLAKIESTSLNHNRSSGLSSKKLTQGTLNFQSSKMNVKTIPSASRSLLNLSASDNNYENPFSIFKKPAQTPKSCGLSNASEISPSLLEKTSLNIPQRTSSVNFVNFESQPLPSTSNQLQNSGPLSPEAQPTSPKSINILSIEKLKKMIPNIGKGKFKIKGKFKAVAEKLQHTNDSYHFVIVVEDITGDLTVQMHSDLVTNIAGIGPEELGRLRELALQKDEDVRRKIVNVLANLHQTCLTLDNVLEIQVIRGEKYPFVINIC